MGLHLPTLAFMLPQNRFAAMLKTTSVEAAPSARASDSQIAPLVTDATEEYREMQGMDADLDGILNQLQGISYSKHSSKETKSKQTVSACHGAMSAASLYTFIFALWG
jgi:hypothetical protein